MELGLGVLSYLVAPLTLKRVGGRNQPTALSMAYCFVCDEVRSVKPSCIFHFWCLKQVKNLNFEKKKFCQSRDENFEKSVFCKKFQSKLYFSMSNWNLECFQLSFDIHIAYVGKKWHIFKFFILKASKFSKSN